MTLPRGRRQRGHPCTALVPSWTNRTRMMLARFEWSVKALCFERIVEVPDGAASRGDVAVHLVAIVVVGALHEVPGHFPNTLVEIRGGLECKLSSNLVERHRVVAPVLRVLR